MKHRVTYYVLVLMTCSVLSLEGNAHSEYSSSFTTNSQNASCEDLNYKNDPICHITDYGLWTCLKNKALSIEKKLCYKLQGLHSEEKAPSKLQEDHVGYRKMCHYLEICAFADEDFFCNGNYNCSVIQDGIVNCSKDGQNFFTKNCTSSLVHCNFAELNGTVDRHAALTGCISFFDPVTDFEDHCISSYENNSNNHSVWYFVKISHYANKSMVYNLLESVHHSNWSGDATKLCPKQNRNGIQGTSTTTVWPMALLCIIALIAMLYAVYEGRTKWEKKNKDLKEGVEHFWAAFIASGDAVVPEDKNAVFSENCDAISNVDKTWNSEVVVPSPIHSFADSSNKDFSHSSEDVGHSSQDLTISRDNPSYVARCNGSFNVPNEFSSTSLLQGVYHSCDLDTMDYDSKDSVKCMSDVLSSLDERYKPYMPKNLEIEHN